VLVNNAGTPLHRAFMDCSVAELGRVMQVNYMGTVHWMRAALPAMVARGRGAVVNVASTAGAVPWTWEAGYSASKAAVIALTEAVAPELARAGVHCGWVNPGLVRTEIFSEEALRHVPPGVQRSFLEPSAVARAIAGAIPWTWEAGYSASKAALIALADAAAPELAHHGVHVCWVNPGIVRTDIFTAEAIRHLPPSAARTRLEPERVSAAILDAVRRERASVTVPRSLAVAAALRSVLPGPFRAGVRRTYEATLRRDGRGAQPE